MADSTAAQRGLSTSTNSREGERKTEILGKNCCGRNDALTLFRELPAVPARLRSAYIESLLCREAKVSVDSRWSSLLGEFGV